MKVLSRFGKIPYLDKEWAFWGYAAAEVEEDEITYTGKWREWLRKANRYKKTYNRRGLIRQKCNHAKLPKLAYRIVIFYHGNCLKEVTLTEIFFELDHSPETFNTLDRKLSDIDKLDITDVQKIIMKDEAARKNYTEIIYTLQQLMSIGWASSHCNGNISISFPD
ncbi:hypothetical protein EXT65_21270 [Pectobacterium carotovorum subsp. carotovorum]|nr:hypothetical protein [Pectobacterium carotovorum]MCL6336326.1 hypothetical protein [Pectobacterium carotovorum subsp. carotovorum]